MLQDKINSIHGDVIRAVRNNAFSRQNAYYIRYIKDKYAEYLNNEDISFNNIFRENEELITIFIETKLEHIKAYTTFNNNLNALILFYKYLNKRGIVNQEDLTNIIKLINKYRKKPPALQKREKYIQLTDLYRMIRGTKHWINYQDPIRFKMIVFFVYYTGIRRVELSTLKRIDFDLERCSVKIRDRVCYYPSEIRDMIKTYFDSEGEVKNAFNFTNAVAGRFNKMLGRYRYLGEKVSLTFLRDSNANLIMKKTKNIGLLAKLHGELTKKDIEQYGLKDSDAEYIYKKKIHYFKERRKIK